MIKKLVVETGKFCYVLLHRILLLFQKIKRSFITGYYTSGMKDVGNRVSINYPVDCIMGREYITIGDYTVINKRATITAWNNVGIPTLSIGSRVSIGEDCHITAINKITIGDGTLLGKRVTITDNSHGYMNLSEMKEAPINRDLYSKGPVAIGNNVWIGDKATICAGVEIGEGSIVGANSVVTHDVPPYTIVAGVPAKVIRALGAAK